MALDKAINSGKEKRKPYRDSRKFDVTCRNHNSCSHCSNGRQYQKHKALEKSDYDLKPENQS